MSDPVSVLAGMRSTRLQLSCNRASTLSMLLQFLCRQVVSLAEANYTLEILVEGYQNPTHQAMELINFRHGCCEIDSALPCRSCDNAFKFCIREGITGMVQGVCDVAELETGLTELNNDDLTFSQGYDIGGLSNPLIVSGAVWTVSCVCMCVECCDHCTTVAL